jgi:hypothetical protein
MELRLRGKHSLADFLNDTFSLVPRIWKYALPASIAALLPGIALWIGAMSSLGSWIRSIAANADSIKEDPSLALSGIAPFVCMATLAVLALFLGEAFQKAFVCAQAGAAIDGRETSLRELASETFRPAWIRVAVQDAVISSLAYAIAFAVIGAVFFPFLLGKLGDIARIKESEGPGIGFVFSFVAVYLASMLIAAAAVWWLRVKTSVSAPAAVLEKVNSFSGIGRSLELVRGRGWRIFGVMFIVSLVISFGLGILTGPLTFAVVIPGYLSFLKESLSGGTPSIGSILALISSMGWALGVTMLVSGVVKGALWPSFLVLLHSDLRIRAGEREPWIGDEASLPRPAPETGDPIPGESENLV